MSQRLNAPQPRAELLPLHIYVPGSSHVDGVAKIHKLSSNETPLGPSPLAIEAMKAKAESLADYPDGGAGDLRKAIGEAEGLNPDQIICGNGSDEFFTLLANAFLQKGDEAIYTQHGFLVYPIAIVGAGATPVIAAETNYTANVDAILDCVTDKTRMVFLANPNNPTGTYLSHSEVKRLHAALPKHVMLVLDGAYAEYIQTGDYSAGMDLVSDNENVVMTRTFSKIHGLAALRIGWMYAPQAVVDVLQRIRPPFNVNAAAQAAGAAAIGDKAHVAKAVEHNTKWLKWFSAELESLGLEVTPSVGNFCLVHFGDDAPMSAAEVLALLNSKGYLVRGVGGYGLPEALRITIGTEEALRGVIATLKTAFGE